MSFVRSVLVAAIATVTFAGAAYARDAVFTLKLEAPVSEPTRVIAQNAIWDCTGDTCVARVNHAASVRACRQFVREAGEVRIVAYGPEGGELNADEIARCNRDASSTQQAQN